MADQQTPPPEPQPEPEPGTVAFACKQFIERSRGMYPTFPMREGQRAWTPAPPPATTPSPPPPADPHPSGAIFAQRLAVQSTSFGLRGVPKK
jgi:hypothetical protein